MKEAHPHMTTSATATTVQQLARFSAETSFSDLPAPVVAESKRQLLDAIGCALAATDFPKGRAGIAYARCMGPNGNATILGTRERVSPVAAAFANAELINSLDMDGVLPPGHVSPYAIPGALAVAEVQGVPGTVLIEAVAIAHEISHRFGLAMDNLRDTRDGKSAVPEVFGYSSTIFGAAAAIGKVKGFGPELLTHAIGIAGCVSPVNYQMFWYQHPPASTLKYCVGGVIAQQAMTAAHLAEFGHTGDAHVIDDTRWGYRKFIGTTKWEPQHLTRELGREWLFPAVSSYKPYAHCRIMHSSIECLTQLLDEEGIQPHEIDSIKVYIEGFAEQPAWLSRDITNLTDAQFSTAHSMAMAAHRPATARAWQDPELVFSRSVMNLMAKVQTEVHPDYARLLTANRASRPAYVELRARGQVFVREKQYPKGSPSPDASTFMRDEELQQKFRDNAQGTLSASATEQAIETLMNLERIEDTGQLMRLLVGGAA